MSANTLDHTSTVAALYIEALRQGQGLWFRVASESMLPLLRKGDEVYIEPAKADNIRIGEIAAFQTSQGLMIHRIVHIQQTKGIIRLLQMSDVELLPTWVKPEAVVGRVMRVRRQKADMSLYYPVARWSGKVTAQVRYQLYTCTNAGIIRIFWRAGSRFAILGNNLVVRCFCRVSKERNT